MNLSNKVLKLLGMKIASQMLETEVTPETKLWRAVITLAVEDVLNRSQSRNESVMKAEAHDWFVGGGEDFDLVCFNAELDPDFVRDRYLRALDTGHVTFTKKQHMQVKYTEMYETMRKEKHVQKRKRLQKTLEKLRQKLFQS